TTRRGATLSEITAMARIPENSTILTPVSWYYVKLWAALFGAGQQLLPTPSKPRSFATRRFLPSLSDPSNAKISGGQ
ncbi:MAG: hypothetical protein ACK5GZ_02070, partial [Cyanobium sp.]